jgi:hypothetical protein
MTSTGKTAWYDDDDYDDDGNDNLEASKRKARRLYKFCL